MRTELLAWLINATVATSLVAGVILLLRKPLQRLLGAEIAYRLWMALPLATLAACFSLPHTATVASSTQAPLPSTPAVIISVTSSLRSVDADRWLIAIWLLGACAVLAVLTWQQRRFVLRLRLRERADGSWRSGVENAAPAVLGVLRQKLVLPECFETDYSDTEQRLVIAHERMHQRRRDPWALATCALLRTVFWFNPIVHVAATRFRRDVELACDAAVLRAHPRSRRRYADALLKTHFAGQPAPVGCHWHNTPPMKERIMLLKHALPARRVRLAGAILVGIAAVASAGIALAGHDAALSTASALAATAAPTASSQSYAVKLTMRVNGKQVANPSVVARAGETAMVKLDANGVAWGFRFHVDAAQRGATALSGEVFSGDERHVIGHSHLEQSNGTPFEIAMQEKPGSPRFVIDAIIERASDAPHAATLDHQVAAPGERREERIVVGAPGDTYDIGHVDDETVPGDDAGPGQQREVHEIRTCSRPDAAGHATCRVTRNVTSRAPANRADIAPLPPLPPTAPRPQGETPPPPPPPPLPPQSGLTPMAPLPPLPPLAQTRRVRVPLPPAPPRDPQAMPPPPPMQAPNDASFPSAPPAPPAPEGIAS